MHEQNEKFDKETSKPKPSKNQKEILPLKNTRSELKNSVKNLKYRLSHAEEIIRNMEERILEIDQSEEYKKERIHKD